jgi:short-subunit dehydrogenase
LNRIVDEAVNVVLNEIFPVQSKGGRRGLAIAAGAVAVLWAGQALLRKRRVYELRGKTVFITGGSRGLGLVLAREFVRHGARVGICARDAVVLERAREELAGRGGEVFSIACDLSDRKEAEQAIYRTQQEFGEIDILVNNAGIINVGPLEEMTISDFEDAMQTNYWAALYTTLAALPQMRARKSGRIVNIASVGGKISVPHLLPYSASKFALVGLSTGLRAELAGDGISVTTVCPGLMRTGSPRNATFKGRHQAEYAWFSVSDSLPIISISAEKAARQIVAACKRGDAEIVLSLPAQFAVQFQSLFPALTADLLGVVTRLLPAPGGIGKGHARGAESESFLSPSILTSLSDQAARENNQ